MLIAVTTASATDQFGLDVVQVDGHTTTEKYVEVLERNGRHVRAVQGRQRFGAVRDLTAVVDAL